MSPEYRQILEQADKLQAEYKKQPCHLERLYGKYDYNATINYTVCLILSFHPVDFMGVGVLKFLYWLGCGQNQWHSI